MINKKNKISVIGTGYVGLITGTGLAKLGNQAYCVDIDKEKVDSLNNKKPTIYEKGLKELLKIVVPKKLTATKNLKKAILDSKLTFISVGTPSRKRGYSYLYQLKN